MSIPNEALQKLVHEIETQATLAQREINVVKTARSAKHRDVRKLELTKSELKNLPANTKVYQGVGKMFVFSPGSITDRKLLAEIAELKLEVANLDKKMHYLETTYNNSREHIDQIFKSRGRS